MPPDLANLKSQASELSESERADLALTLLQSLEGALDESGVVKEAWADEIRRRVADEDAGTAEIVPGDLVFSELRKKLSA